MQPFTRAQFRDEIRLAVGKTPAIALGGVSGQPNPRQPKPNNWTIDRCINNALSNVNRKLSPGRTPAPVAISIEAQTADGPYRVDLSEARQGVSGSLLAVRHAYWYDGTSTSPLTLADYQGTLRAGDQPERTAVGDLPTHYWVDGNALYLLPAPLAAGTLYIEAGTGLSIGPGDGDTIPSLPGDMCPCVVNAAAALVAAATPDDVEMRSRLQLLAPLAQDGIDDLTAWLITQATRGQTRMTLAYPYPSRS